MRCNFVTRNLAKALFMVKVLFMSAPFVLLVLGGGLLYAGEAASQAAPAAKDTIKAAPAAVKDTSKAAQHAYVGIAKCKMCHMPYFKAWATTPHATTFDQLKSSNKEDKNPKCLKCHTTGFGTGGYDAAKPTPDFKNVQCETCHGPGADYMKMAIMKDPAKAKSAGLVFPVPESVCVKCHNKESPNFKGFDYAKYVAKGVHRVEKKAPETK
jgi:hypothetical protein